MNKNYQTLYEMLEVKNKTTKKKTKKGLSKRIVALTAAFVIALSAGTVAILNHFKKKDNSIPKTPKDSISTEINNLDDMGTELDFTTNPNEKYGQTTGNVDKNKIVEKNGKIYADKENADKSNKVGNTVIDTKNNTLEVKNDGTVVDKNKGYEIKDQNGNTIQQGNLSGNNSLPNGYVKDEEIDKIVKEEAGNYVYADATYYDSDGKIVLKKGDLVLKETLEKVKKYYSTTKPSVSNSQPTNTPSQPTTSTPSKEETTNEKGVINKDGTYTIYGTTYLTKADYEQCILNDFQGYGIVNGIVRPVDQTKVSQKIK